MRSRWRGRASRALLAIAILAVLYAAAAYVVLPRLWLHYEHEPGLADRPMVTRTADDIPGDPLNVALVGTKEEAIRVLAGAGWYPADPLTLKTAIAIAGSVVFDRPYREAPVSALFYEGRREDFAFEKPAGNSADRRHHVRFWQALGQGAAGRPVFVGAATFDRGSGLSRYTGEITHHIAADIDAERDLLIADLTAAGMLTATFDVTGVGLTLFGRNGGGDRYFTDGEMTVGIVSPGARKHDAPPAELADPPAVEAKNAIWDWARSLF